MGWFYEIRDSNKTVTDGERFCYAKLGYGRWQKKGKRTESFGFVAERSRDCDGQARLRNAD